MPGVLNYLGSEASSLDRQYAANEVMSLYGEKHPREALDWMNTNLGTLDKNAMRRIVSGWMDRDLAAATTYLKAIENPQVRLPAMESTLWQWSGTNAGEAAAWMQTLPVGPDGRLARSASLLLLRARSVGAVFAVRTCAW